jgi:hypothetical protein
VEFVVDGISTRNQVRRIVGATASETKMWSHPETRFDLKRRAHSTAGQIAKTVFIDH